MSEQPLTQAQDHDRRLGRLEGIAEQLDRRLDDFQHGMNTRFNAIERAIAELRQDQRRDFRILVGMQLTTLIALGTLILSRLPG